MLRTIFVRSTISASFAGLGLRFFWLDVASSSSSNPIDRRSDLNLRYLLDKPMSHRRRLTLRRYARLAPTFENLILRIIGTKVPGKKNKGGYDKRHKGVDSETASPDACTRLTRINRDRYAKRDQHTYRDGNRETDHTARHLLLVWALPIIWRACVTVEAALAPTLSAPKKTSRHSFDSFRHCAAISCARFSFSAAAFAASRWARDFTCPSDHPYPFA